MAVASETNVAMQRKPRIVKNSYANVESVDAPPGESYVNWTKITRQKLKERDRNLLSVKIHKIQNIVNTIFAGRNVSASFTISNAFIQNTLDVLYHAIDYEWKGVNVARLKKEPSTFRAYFLLGKNWWYSRKKKLIGNVFWLKLFRCIRCHIDTKEHFTHDSMLFMRIIQGLFGGMVQFANTKPLPLINHATVTECKDIQRYLIELHHSLDIQSMMREQRDYAKCNRGIGSLVVQQLRLRLANIIQNQTESSAIGATHHEENIAHNSNRYTPSVATLCEPVTTVPVQSMVHIPSIMSHAYGATHGVAFSVQGMRSSPMMTMQPIGIVYPNNDAYGITYGIYLCSSAPN